MDDFTYLSAHTRLLLIGADLHGLVTSLGDGLLLESVSVPLLELSDQLLLLVIDSLLGVASLLLQVLQILVALAVLLLEFFQLTESLQLFFIDDFSLLAVTNLIKAISLTGEARMEALGDRVAVLLFDLGVKEASDLIDLVLDSVDFFSLRAQLEALLLQVRATLDDLLLDNDSLLRGFELTECDLLLDGRASLRVGILLLAHASKHSILLLLENELILSLLFLLEILHGSNLCLFLL